MKKSVLFVVIVILITAAIAAIFHFNKKKFKNSVAAVKSGNLVTVCIDGNLSVIDTTTDKIIKQGGKCKVQIIEL